MRISDKRSKRSGFTKFLMVVAAIYLTIIAYFSVRLSKALFEGDFLFSILYFIVLLLSLFQCDRLMKTPLDYDQRAYSRER